MGLYLAGTLSDILLTDLFDKKIPEFKFKPAILKKFVDDIITTAPFEHVVSTKDLLCDDRLIFTYETEIDNKINFLGMTLVHQRNGRIITNWYSKPTSSNRILNYISSHLHVMKWNIATTVVHKVFSLSDPIFTRMNTESIYNILMKNNYPPKIIEKAIKNYRMKRISSLDMDSTRNERTIVDRKYAGIQYIPTLSENIARTFRTSIPNLTIAPKPTKKLKMIFSNMKSKIGKYGQRNVIYNIPCEKPKICLQNHYIGHTYE